MGWSSAAALLRRSAARAMRHAGAGRYLARLQALREQITNPDAARRSAELAELRRAGDLVNLGLPQAGALLDSLAAGERSGMTRRYLAQLQARHRETQRLGYLRWIFADRKLMRELSSDTGFVHIPNPAAGGRLAVAFTTTHNNFGFSNAVLAALLLDCGYSVLLLKEKTRFRYLKGVPGLGGTLDEVAAGVQAFARSHGIRHITVTGFSSGGFAAVYLATLIDGAEAAGFAIETDFTPQARDRRGVACGVALQPGVASSYLCRLRDRLLAGGGTPNIRLYCGTDDPFDMAQAQQLADVPGCSVVHVPGAGHQLTLAMLERGELKAAFSHGT